MKEAEEIIISKRFFELTPSELEAVKEFAANEEDYEAMRWFLQQTKTSFAEEKIVASPNLRAGVMAHLNQQPASKTIWLNGVGAFLFPAQKKFYQYPAFQMAAVAILLVGFVFLYDGRMSESDQGLASNDLENEQVISENKIVTEDVEKTGEVVETVPVEEAQDLDARTQPGTTGPLVNAPEEVVVELDDEISVVGASTNLLAMSVAEESKASLDEKVFVQQPYGESNMISPDQNAYRVDNATSTGSGVETKNVAPTDDIVLSENLKKESTNYKDNDKSKSSNDGKTTVTGTTVSAPVTTTVATNENAGYVNGGTTRTEKADDEGGNFLTGSAGGVFGDTASEPEAEKVLDVETPVKDFSLEQTKELRSLFFVVK